MKWRNNPPVPLPAVCLATSALLFYRQPPLLPVGADELHLTPSCRFTEDLPGKHNWDCRSELTKETCILKKLFACLKPQWHDGRLLWLLKANVGLWVKNKIFSNIPRLQTFVATDQEETSQIPRPQTRLYWTVRPLQRSLCVCSAGKEK